MENHQEHYFHRKVKEKASGDVQKMGTSGILALG